MSWQRAPHFTSTMDLTSPFRARQWCPVLFLAFLMPVSEMFANVPFRYNITGLDYDAVWGTPGVNHDTSISEFRVEFNDIVIQDLRNRLSSRRPVTPSYDGVWFDYGINSAVVEDWADYWENKYCFKDREQIINQFPHYQTNIQGLDVHFIRIRPQAPANVEVVPILVQNGWPSSVMEFYDALPLLTKYDTNRNFVLEVVVASLPGFTLSEGSNRPGLSAPDIGVILRNLMQRLGYKKYYLAGSDFGSIACSTIATLFPDEVLGFHASTIVLLSANARVPFNYHLANPQAGQSIYFGNMTGGRTNEDEMKNQAYLAYQVSNPDTLGVVLNDSPVGLLAYILEKFHWSLVLERKQNAGSRLESYISRDKFLDNLMLYWITGSIATSMRIYLETMSPRVAAMNIDEIPTPVPTWVTEAKYELSRYPIGFIKSKYPNLFKYKPLDFGGHFFSFEQPQYFAEDVLAAVTAFRSWHIKENKNEL